jgi:hypothetical protein
LNAPLGKFSFFALLEINAALASALKLTLALALALTLAFASARF